MVVPGGKRPGGRPSGLCPTTEHFDPFLPQVIRFPNFAWFLTTCPSAKHRNGERAVALAMKALALRESVARLDTLGAALAEAGRFQQAIETQQRIIALGGSEEAQARLALYRDFVVDG